MDGKVFILEDDTSICGLIKVALEMNGLEFKAYSTVNEFIAGINVEQPDVALLDIMLPGKDGFELLEELKALHSENEKLKSRLAGDSLGDVMNQAQEVNGVTLLATKVSDVDMNGLRELGDQLKEKLGEGVVVLVSEKEGKVNLIAMATDGAIAKGAHAGNLIKAVAPLVGGGGGGRPNMAQAGGKNPAAIPDALEKAVQVMKSQLA